MPLQMQLVSCSPIGSLLIKEAIRGGRCRFWRKRGPFRISGFHDPGELYAQLNTKTGRDLLCKVFWDVRRRGAGQPRLDTYPRIDRAERAAHNSRERRDIDQIKSWFNHAYQKSVALIEKATVIESVWVKHFTRRCERTPSLNGLLRKLGEFNDQEWLMLQRSEDCKDLCDRWESGHLSTLTFMNRFADMVGNKTKARMTLSRGNRGGDTIWKRRLYDWLDGPLMYEDVWIPPRYDASEDAPRVLVYEYAGIEPELLSVTAYSRRLFD